MLKLQQKENNMILVKEPYEFIKGKYNLSILTMQVLSLLFSKIDPFNDEEFKRYEISVKEIEEIFGKTYGNLYEYVKNTFRNLIDVKIELEDENEWKIFTIVIDPSILKRNGTIAFYISPSLLNLLRKSKHYLKYDISILAYFNSSYALRLYKLLRDRLEVNKKYGFTAWEVSLEELIELLQIPYSRYSNIKQKVLSKALEEINTYSDIKVEYEEIKKGRKVEKLLFKIDYKDKKNNKPNPPVENKGGINNLRNEIIQKYNNKDKFFKIDDKEFSIRENLLFLNDKALDAKEAIKWWNFIAKNKDKIEEVDPTEEAKKEFKEFLIGLNKTYFNKTTLIPTPKGVKKVSFVKATGEDIENLEVAFKDLENPLKGYTGIYSLDRLKNLFI